MKQFDKKVVSTILEVKEELRPLIEKLDFTKIAKYNRGYLKYRQEPVKSFIDFELTRYLHTVNYIYSTHSVSAVILDVGFFIPVIPIALSKLGFKISAIEKLSFYNGSLDEIIAFTKEKYGISVLDFDFLMDNISELKNKFDIILLLAIFEHLNGTPKYLIERVRNIAKPDSHIITEVPNIASLTNRLVFLKKGIPPLPSFEDYFHSEYPFSGHNREYTIDDLKYAMDNSGFDIIHMKTFHQSVLIPDNIKMRLLHGLEKIGPASWKPNIWAVAKPRKD